MKFISNIVKISDNYILLEAIGNDLDKFQYAANLRRIIYENIDFIADAYIIAKKLNLYHDEQLENLIKSKKQDYTLEELYNKIKSFDYSLDMTDYMKIYEKIFNISFCKNTVLKTDAVVKIYHEEGYRRDLSWWNDYYHLNYDVFIEKDSSFLVDDSKIYTLEQIADFEKNKNILVLKRDFEKFQPVDYIKENKKAEETKEIKIMPKEIDEDILEKNKEIVIEYVFSNITKKFIRRIINECMDNIKTLISIPTKEGIAKSYQDEDGIDRLYFYLGNIELKSDNIDDWADYIINYDKTNKLSNYAIRWIKNMREYKILFPK